MHVNGGDSDVDSMKSLPSNIGGYNQSRDASNETPQGEDQNTTGPVTPKDHRVSILLNVLTCASTEFGFFLGVFVGQDNENFGLVLTVCRGQNQRIIGVLQAKEKDLGTSQLLPRYSS